MTQSGKDITAKVKETCDGKITNHNLSGTAGAAEAPTTLAIGALDAAGDQIAFSGNANSCNKITGTYDAMENTDSGNFNWTK